MSEDEMEQHKETLEGKIDMYIDNCIISGVILDIDFFTLLNLKIE